ncbi:MAG: helix-turn-helix transcriptional regulator [Eubacteriales bacterium]|nr:helix-turn-helix transcriptional regulator [Eubacteriales bacterium]
MSNEHEYLPGSIRDRIQDLMKERKITQAELAVKISMTESALSRFVSGKTEKGQKKLNRKITAEQVGEAVAQSVAHLPGVDTEAVKQMFLAMTGTVQNNEQDIDGQ